MALNVAIFGPLFVLCAIFSFREWLRWRRHRTTAYYLAGELVCTLLCAIVLLNVADERWRTVQAERCVRDAVRQLQSGNLPDLDPDTPKVFRDMMAAYKGGEFPKDYTFEFVGSVTNHAIAEVTFPKGKKLRVELRDISKSKMAWPPLFATPQFKVALLLLSG